MVEGGGGEGEEGAEVGVRVMGRGGREEERR